MIINKFGIWYLWETYMPEPVSPVLVTGCAGGIGRVVCTAFKEAGYQVFGIDAAECTIPGVDTAVLDLADPAAIEAYCAGLDEPITPVVPTN